MCGIFKKAGVVRNGRTFGPQGQVLSVYMVTVPLTAKCPK